MLPVELKNQVLKIKIDLNKVLFLFLQRKSYFLAYVTSEVLKGSLNKFQLIKSSHLATYSWHTYSGGHKGVIGVIYPPLESWG